MGGRGGLTADAWDGLRHKWRHVHGLTNIWSAKPLQGPERIKRTGSGPRKSPPRSAAKTGQAALHLNQKPLDFMRRMMTSATTPGDVVWEPFGGLASASVAAIELGRFPCAAEINPEFQRAALLRLQGAASKRY